MIERKNTALHPFTPEQSRWRNTMDFSSGSSLSGG